MQRKFDFFVTSRIKISIYIRAVHERRPQSGGEEEFVQCGQGGWVFRSGHLHLLVQKNFGFFLWCVRTDKWRGAFEPVLQIFFGQGEWGSVFRDFVRMPFMDDSYSTLF